MELSEALFNLMHAVRSNILHKIKMLDIELTPMHLKSLKVIANMEACTGQKLANFMGRDKAQVNRLIKELVNQQLVIKMENTQDKRSQLLVLSASGEEIMTAFAQAEKEVFEKMIGDIPAANLEGFIDIANRLKANLD